VFKKPGAIRLLQLASPEAPEDVEPTLRVFEFFQDEIQTRSRIPNLSRNWRPHGASSPRWPLWCAMNHSGDFDGIFEHPIHDHKWQRRQDQFTSTVHTTHSATIGERFQRPRTLIDGSDNALRRCTVRSHISALLDKSRAKMTTTKPGVL